MFCPQCRFEYAADKKACPDCGAPLVASLTTPDDPEYVELITVYRTNHNPDLLVAQSLLESAGIEFSASGAVYGGGELGISMVAGQVQLQVHPDDAEEALEILAGMESENDEDADPEE
jgi:hypothetical protein